MTKPQFQGVVLFKCTRCTQLSHDPIEYKDRPCPFPDCGGDRVQVSDEMPF